MSKTPWELVFRFSDYAPTHRWISGTWNEGGKNGKLYIGFLAARSESL